MARWAAPMGSPGCLALCGDPGAHGLWAEHMLAELPKETQGSGRKLVEWVVKPGHDNHWLDCAVGCCVAASTLGIAAAGMAHSPRRRGRVIMGQP